MAALENRAEVCVSMSTTIMAPSTACASLIYATHRSMSTTTSFRKLELCDATFENGVDVI